MRFNGIIDGSTGHTGRFHCDVVDEILIQEVVATAVTVIELLLRQIVYIDSNLRLTENSQMQDALIRKALSK